MKKPNVYCTNHGGEKVYIRAYSMKQAAEFLGISPSTFSKWGYKVGPGYRGIVNHDLTEPEREKQEA